MFYEFNQNNSGGSFEVDSVLCKNLIIEADSEKEAIEKAEDLGCYWDGVSKGMDCPCCGDRWYKNPDLVNEEHILKTGIGVNEYVGIYGGRKATMNRWQKLYGKYKAVEEPDFKQTISGSEEVLGKIIFDSIEDFIQFETNQHGWDFGKYPNTRIFYKDGSVKEFFKNDFMD